MAQSIEEVNINNKKEYDQYILTKKDSTFVDLWEWRNVLEGAYKLKHFWYIYREKHIIKGSLALTLARNPIIGTYLCTAPFASNGGFHAESERALKALLDKAIELQQKFRAKYTVIRHLDFKRCWMTPAGWINDDSYATYQLPLTLNADFFFKKHIKRKVREHIKKAKRFEFQVKFGRIELINDFWYVITRAMRELGSPYHSKSYIKTLINKLGKKANFSILYDALGRPVCCRLFIEHDNRAFSIHGNSLRKYRSMNAGDYFYWLFIKECYNRGIKSIDLGRSLIGSGHEVYKMKWRPNRFPLTYWYHMTGRKKLPMLNQNNPKFRFIIKTWQKLPLWFLEIIGPRLISGIL